MLCVSFRPHAPRLFHAKVLFPQSDRITSSILITQRLILIARRKCARGSSQLKKRRTHRQVEGTTEWHAKPNRVIDYVGFRRLTKLKMQWVISRPDREFRERVSGVGGVGGVGGEGGRGGAAAVAAQDLCKLLGR
jgi:hypothetical protein